VSSVVFRKSSGGYFVYTENDKLRIRYSKIIKRLQETIDFLKVIKIAHLKVQDGHIMNNKDISSE
jgi:hypothetical protein